MLSSSVFRSTVCQKSVRSFGTSVTRSNSLLFPKLESITQADLALHKPSSTGSLNETFSPTGDNEWYYISRSRGKQLPVYCEIRANGHRSTIIRKIQGSTPLLKSDLMAILGLSKEDIKIKQTSNQIVIKGDHVKTLKSLLEAAKF